MIGLKCPICGYEKTEVQTTRRTQDSIIRNRICLNCGEIFKTVEDLDESARPKRGRKPKRKRR